jgi:hypothetical protein
VAVRTHQRSPQGLVVLKFSNLVGSTKIEFFIVLF